MDKIKINFKAIIILSVIIVIDLFVFILLGLLLMNYDDFYDSSKGEYWSLASMNMQEKLIYISFNVWIFLNVIGIIYLIWRIYKRKQYST